MQLLRSRVYNLLRWSEKFTKTDMVYATKGGFWLSLGQVLASVASLVLALLFARFIPKDIYGNYKYILALAGLASTFSLTGISSGVLQSVSRGYLGTFVEAVRLLIRWNSLIFVFSLAGSAYYLLNNNLVLGYSLLVVALTFPVIRTVEVYEAYINGKRNFRRSAMYRGVVDVATVIVTALAILYSGKVVVLVGANMISQLVLNYLFFRKVYKEIPTDQRDKVEHDVISFSKHLSVQNVFTNISSYLDRVAIFHFLGAAEVAIYSFAIAIPTQIKSFVANLATIATPKLANKSFQEAADAIPQRFFVSLLFLIPIFLLYFVSAPFIFSILFPTYIEAVPYSRWYALILLLMGNLSDLVLTTQKATREKYILNIFASISQITLILMLVQRFKIHGVIFAILISKTLSAILAYILARQTTRKKEKRAQPV